MIGSDLRPSITGLHVGGPTGRMALRLEALSM